MKLNAKQIGAIFIAALFGLSFIGYIGIGGNNHSGQSNLAGSQTIDYNGHKIISESNYWRVDVANQARYFLNPPTALETFEVPANLNEVLSNSKVYLAYDPTQEVDLVQIRSIAYNFFNPIGIQSFPACVKEEFCPDIPIIDCTQDHAIVFLQDNSTTSITTNNNCIEFRALNSATMVRQLERVFYTALGVMS